MKYTDPRDRWRKPAARTGTGTWYEIHNATTTATVRIYEEIGMWGVSADQFAEDLGAITAPNIEVQINSPGGDVFDGLAIFNALRLHPAHVTTRVDGLAASAASVIVQAGDERIVVDAGQMMIHNAWGLAIGDADDLTAMAAILAQQNEVLAGIYAARGNGDADHYRDLMKNETWFTAQATVDEGLADRVLDPAGSAAAALADPIHHHRTTNGDTMPTPTVMPDTSPVPPVAANVTAAVVNVEPPALVDQATFDRRIAELEDSVARATAAPAGASYSTPVHPLAQFPTLVDFADAMYGSADALALRGLLIQALADQVTTDNPGVMPPGWVTTVYGILERSRPLIDAFGTEPLPPAGMDVNWPYFDGDLLTLVGVQAVEKTAITSVKVSLKKGVADLVTYAGGSDISYQLIRRSSPSYRDAYLRIMFAAYAAVTDKAAATAAVAAGTGTGTVDVAGDGAALRSALFAASIAVETATGSPATFALAASDVFLGIGGLADLFPSMYGTQNASGTADASTLSVNVSGLRIIHDPFLAAGTLLVSNGQAAGWWEEGPMTVAAPDVEKLGENVAVWGMGTFGATVPAGIVKITGAPTIPEAKRSAAKSK